MQKKWLIIMNVSILIILTLILLSFIWSYSYNPKIIEPEECIEINKVASFVYDSCYDAYSKNIFLEVSRSYDQYQLQALEFSFFDFFEKSYELTDVPMTNESKAYKIPAERNPQNINVRLKIKKSFSAPVCEEPRKLFVRYCPSGIQQEGVNVSISPLNGRELGDFVEIVKSPSQDSDIMSLDLVEKERIWKSQCESRWECSDWGDCENGVSNRACTDTKDCFIPTDMPGTAKYCDQGCLEMWECEWSKCSGGYTTPSCKDLNKCGTSYQIPQKLECTDSSKCVPDIKCDPWSSCDVDYNFLDLVGGSISELKGIKTRVCRDENSCLPSKEENRSCSVSVDIYTKRFTKCGAEFVGVYNRLNNELIARIEEGYERNPYLNLYLEDRRDSAYCDYCFDGITNGDEEGVDCGGSCEACSDKYKRTTFKKKTWSTKLFDWVKAMVT